MIYIPFLCINVNLSLPYYTRKGLNSFAQNGLIYNTVLGRVARMAKDVFTMHLINVYMI